MLTPGGRPAYLVYGFLLVIYFVLCWLISLVRRRREQHFTRHLTRADEGSPLPRAMTQVVPT
ncbi:hypothetical protein C7450_101408 [Chelatococcus asaccharovorans]|uniref:Heme exporter protein D n=1 Tax=Chelatococcus asaccharovorans TaxID=28210 RepID=A0A2V3UHN6_9HYPH|nr:hypothetical protein C7450_101408 [Chelatococcus asaccharovorans]